MELAIWTVLLLVAAGVVVVTLPVIAVFLWRISTQQRVLIDLTAQAYIDGEVSEPG
ncbi:hypothetical protein [Ornithinimicrobium sufpigmenti]|uniref:hypothetical protein n=1 Tax=Ornithinimicrobium sufpigmenti TaxID=2508882 RepID=UPI0015E1B83F|nr:MULTISPECIES: hypothetical protein [unclassified Ornithinimicrobium]